MKSSISVALLSIAAIANGEEQRDRRSERRSRKLQSSAPNESTCGLEGVWIPNGAICKLVSIGSSTPTGTCDEDHELELVPDYDGNIGTLKGFKYNDGLNLEAIGFYDEEDCEFTMVSTSTGMTIRGVPSGLNLMSMFLFVTLPFSIIV